MTIFKNRQKKISKRYFTTYADIKSNDIIVKPVVRREVPYIIFWIKKIARKYSYTFFKYICASK